MTRTAPAETALKFAVVDVETTGLAFNGHHRIIEIGVVHLDSDFKPELHWETLLNPDRDLGATRLHGIRARDVLDAPEFIDVADELAGLLEGRILVAHNANFDTGFIASEYRRLGTELGDLSPSSVCTMRLAPGALGPIGRGLDVCCTAAGIINQKAHAALSDAIATAQLFGALSGFEHVRSEVRSRIPLTRPTVAPAVDRPRRPLKSRPATADDRPSTSWISEIATAMPRIPVGPAEECYLAVLDRALADRHLSGEEKNELVALASALALNRSTVVDLHTSYLDALTKLALADGVVTDEEHADIAAVAAQLGITVPPEVGSGATTNAVTSVDTTAPVGIVLQAGDRVTFTGEMVVPQEEWERRSTENGLDVGGVTKKSKVLVAADPDSLSGKAKKARAYGIPIVDETCFARLLGEMRV